MKTESEGVCKFCSKTIKQRALARHFLLCAERKKALLREKGKGKVFLIRASAGPFFVYFEANASSTLQKIDSFLRGLWLECCGHLSAFNIGNIRYSSYIEPGDEDRRMNCRLEDVLRSGEEFIHEYDFGTTTQLCMKLLAERRGAVKGMEVLARNNLPDFKCKCAKPAQEVCTQCIWKGRGFFCRACAKKHRCEEEAFLPVVNSPRMGMCGYTGN